MMYLAIVEGYDSVILYFVKALSYEEAKVEFLKMYWGADYELFEDEVSIKERLAYTRQEENIKRITFILAPDDTKKVLV